VTFPFVPTAGDEDLRDTKETFSKERIARLDEIGFIWDARAQH
jgi:hypothetical protein